MIIISCSSLQCSGNTLLYTEFFECTKRNDGGMEPQLAARRVRVEGFPRARVKTALCSLSDRCAGRARFKYYATPRQGLSTSLSGKSGVFRENSLLTINVGLLWSH